MSLDVVTLGETMVLFIPTSVGPLRFANTFEKTIGGAESNVAIGLARLGHRAGWISRLGNDEFGLFVRNFIRGEGVDTSRWSSSTIGIRRRCFSRSGRRDGSRGSTITGKAPPPAG